jgi:hypothetical protein
MSASPDLGWGWGDCARTSGPCNTPAHAALLGDTLEMAVALCRGDVSRATWHRRGAWWHHHRRIRVTFGNGGVNSILIVGPVAGERRYRIRDLVKERANLSRVVARIGWLVPLAGWVEGRPLI